MRRDLASFVCSKNPWPLLLVGVVFTGVACDPAEDQVSAETCSQTTPCSGDRVCALLCRGMNRF